MLIRWKIFLVVLLILAAALGAFSYWTRFSVRSSYLNATQSLLEHEVRMLSRLLDTQAPGLDELVDSLAEDVPYRITVIGPTGKVLADTSFSGSSLAMMENHLNRQEVQEALRRGLGSSVRYSTSVDDIYLYVATVSPAGSFIRVAVPGSRIRQDADSLGGPLFGRGGALLVIGGLAALGAVLYFTSSLSRFETAVRAVANGETPAGLTRTGGEWGDLARALAKQFSGQRQNLRLQQEELSRTRLLVDNIEEGLLLIDSERRVQLVNPAFRKIFEPAVDPIGQTTLEVVRSAELSKALERCLQQDEPVELEFDFGERVIRARLAPLPPATRDGAVVAVFSDVSELRRQETVARDFVANVSHELKTPLTSIKGYGETLLDGNLDPMERRFVEKIDRNAEQLDDIINALLELARLQARQPNLRLEAINFEVFMDQLRGEFQKRLDDKKLQFTVVNRSGSKTFRAAEGSLRRAVYNLIDNAISYTEEGEIRVELSRNEDRVVFAVNDTGMGIDPGDQPRVFERFYRGSSVKSGRGTGVGLSIVKQIVSLHGGEVWLKSQPGSGTTVFFWLPR